MTPRRKHVLLVEGSLYLSARDADLVRVEGRVMESVAHGPEQEARRQRDG